MMDPPLSDEELVEISRKPANYRKPFESDEERKEAKIRARTDARKGMTQPTRRVKDQDKLVGWFRASPKNLGKGSASLGIQLYFSFLRIGFCVLLVWSILVAALMIACYAPSKNPVIAVVPGSIVDQAATAAAAGTTGTGILTGTTATTGLTTKTGAAGVGVTDNTTQQTQESSSTPLDTSHEDPDIDKSDDKVGVTMLTRFSLASFGSVFDIHKGTDREIKIYDYNFKMKDITPLLSALSALGSIIYIVFVLWFKYIVIPKLADQQDAETVTPADFTLQIDNLPSWETILHKSGRSNDDEFADGNEREEFYATELRRHFSNVLKRIKGPSKNAITNIDETDEEHFIQATFPECSLVRDYGGNLQKVEKEAKLKAQIVEATIDNDDKKIQKLQKKAQKIAKKEAKKSAKTLEQEQNRKIYRVFLSCKKAADQKLLEDSYRMSTYTLGYLFQSGYKRFYGKRIVVTRAPEPSNILWENQDCPKLERFFRKGFVVLCVFVLLIASVVGITFAKSEQETMNRKAAGKGCPDPVMINLLKSTATTGVGAKTSVADLVSTDFQRVPLDSTYGKEYVKQIETFGLTAKFPASMVNTEISGHTIPSNPADPANVLDKFQVTADVVSVGSIYTEFSDCECSAIGISNLVLEKSLRNNGCKDYVELQSYMLGVTFLSSFIVVAINLFLKTFLVALAKFERPLTLSGLECAIALKVFIAQFLNTAVIVYVLNWKLFADFFEGEYEEFSHAWYATVGMAITTTMLVNIFSPHCIAVAMSFVQRCKAWCFGCCLFEKCCVKTEKDFDALYEPPQFELAPRCGSILNTVFSSLLFAAGCPILIPFAMLNHFICYFCDKYLLVKVCKRPPSYDQEVILKTVSVIPIAVLLHAGVGLWQFGNRDVFYSEKLIDIQIPVDLPTVAHNFLDLMQRAFYGAGIPYLLVVLLVIVYFVLELVALILGNAFGGIVAAIKSAFISCCCRSKAKKLAALSDGSVDMSNKKAAKNILAEDRTTYLEAQQEWKEQKMISSYLMGDNPNYRHMLSSDLDIEEFAVNRILRRRSSKSSDESQSPTKKPSKNASKPNVIGGIETSACKVEGLHSKDCAISVKEEKSRDITPMNVPQSQATYEDASIEREV